MRLRISRMATGTRKRTTVYLDTDLLTAAKALAASTGRRDYEVFEDALRLYMRADETRASRAELRALLDRVGERSDIGEDEAMKLACSELRAARNARIR